MPTSGSHGRFGGPKRWLALLSAILLSTLVLLQDLLWEPVKAALQQKIGTNPWALLPAILAVISIATAVPLIQSRLKGKADATSDAAAGRQDQRQRARLLNRLEHNYATYLNQSHEDAIKIDIGLSLVPNKTFRATTRILPTREEDQELPESMSLLELFDKGGALESDGVLILGDPGAGKTTLLLELAHQLTKRARADPKHPLPIYLPLSTWAVRRPQLGEWIVEQLGELYQVPQQLAHFWQEEAQILLLLDGLDEISKLDARIACARAINQFSQTYALPLLVCSRRVEYDMIGVRLQLATAVVLRPPNADTLLRYLLEAGPRMRPVATAVQNDPELLDLLRSPLLVNMLMLAYAGVTEPNISVTKGDVLERRRHLIADYVNTRLRLEQQTHIASDQNAQRDYAPGLTLNWLSALALYLSRHQRTVFLPARIQSDWLPTRLARRTVILIPSLAFGGLWV